MWTLHSNVEPESDRPAGLSDYSDAQWARVEAAFATLAAPPQPPAQPAEERYAVHGACASWLRLFIFKHNRDPFPQEVWDASIDALKALQAWSAARAAQSSEGK